MDAYSPAGEAQRPTKVMNDEILDFTLGVPPPNLSGLRPVLGPVEEEQD